jgi:ATP synthase protein I
MSPEDKGNGQDGGDISPEDRAAIRQRSSEIGRKLDAVKAKTAPADQADNRRRGAAFGKAFSFAAELIVGVAAGGLLGWALDRYFGTAPWAMVLFVMLGFAAGLLNVIRSAQRAQAENEAAQLAAPSVTDDEDDDK